MTSAWPTCFRVLHDDQVKNSMRKDEDTIHSASEKLVNATLKSSLVDIDQAHANSQAQAGPGQLQPSYPQNASQTRK
jgi:hypothetical protein